MSVSASSRSGPAGLGERTISGAAAAPPRRLSFARKVTFTVGDFACNLYWQSVSIFLLFFYTDAVGLSAATAGLIYMIASVVDALCDPVMGTIADRTRSRWGRYRPYILFGCVPLGLSFVLLYYRPPLAGVWLAAWMLATHIIFRLAYTALSIPYTSLNARLTDNSQERSTLAGLRMIFAVLAASAIAYFTLPMVKALGKDQTSGFMWAAAVFALVATSIFPLVYLCTREPVEPSTAAAGAANDLVANWRNVGRNSAFWILILSSCVAFVCSTCLGKSVLYYFKYYLHDEPSSRAALSAMSLAGLAIIPAWMFVTRFIGKRNAWLAAIGWGVAMLLLFAAVDIRAPLPMIVWLVAMNVSSLGASFTFWSMLPDTVEYGEWRSGLRTESFIFGLGQFFLKVALGVGAGLFGVLLQFVGYVPNAVQTAGALAGLKTIMVVLPLVGLAGSGLVMIFYPLRRGSHEAIVEQLTARRGAEGAPLPETLI